MASVNTLCKQLLGVKSTVVTGHDFYQGGRYPVHPPDPDEIEPERSRRHDRLVNINIDENQLPKRPQVHHRCR